MASTITDGRIKHNFVFLTQGTFFDKTVLLLETLFLFFSKEATLHDYFTNFVCPCFKN